MDTPVRQIIVIDEEKCDGCEMCVPECPEGALQIINGKARLISDLFCDGLGACIGHCPQDAIRIEERPAEPYNERKVMENIVKGGEDVILAHLEHLKDHHEDVYLDEALHFLKEKNLGIPEGFVKKPSPEVPFSGCPGARMIDMRERGKDHPYAPKAKSAPLHKKELEAESIPRSKQTEQEATLPSELPTQLPSELPSELRQWPIQLALLNPEAPYFKSAHLLVAADCVPFTYADFHRHFLKGKILIIFCPKLDSTIEQYIAKLTHIFKRHDIQSITLMNMQVPCCFGVGQIVQEALRRAEKDIPLKDYTISLRGEIL